MKLDLILENVRNKYTMGLLEESTGMDEAMVLKGKLLINESTMDIRNMLVEEGTIENVKELLTEAWVAKVIEEFEMSDMPSMDDVKDTAGTVVNNVKDFGNSAAGAAQYGAHGIADAGGLAYGDAQDGTKDFDYSKVPGGIADLTKEGYERGYNPDLDIAQTAQRGAWIGENPGKAAALAGAGVGALAGTAIAAPKGIGKATAGARKATAAMRNSAGIRKAASAVKSSKDILRERFGRK